MTKYELWARPRDPTGASTRPDQPERPYLRIAVVDLPLDLTAKGKPDADDARRWNVSMELVYVWTNVEYEFWPARAPDSAMQPDIH